MRKSKLTTVLAAPAILIATVLVPTTTSRAAAAQAPTTRHIHRVGTAQYRPTASAGGAPGALSSEIPRAFGPEASGAAPTAGAPGAVHDRSFAARHPSAGAAAPSAVGSATSAALPSAIIRNGPQLLTSFDGLNHHDQRTANGGNQFSVEPPDQALCVGGGHVVEAVNDVFQVYSVHGAKNGVEDLNTFFGYPAQINRTTGVQGPFVTDPTCLYDPSTKTFFLVVLTLEIVPSTGAFTGDNHLDIAVAKDPTGAWTTYHLDVTDDGTQGTPVHPNCPCIGDYPHIGVDANGFYITTNEYSFFGPQFNSAQIYAFSKRALAAAAANVLVTQFDTTRADLGRSGFTIWPAQSPSVS